MSSTCLWRHATLIGRQQNSSMTSSSSSGNINFWQHSCRNSTVYCDSLWKQTQLSMAMSTTSHHAVLSWAFLQHVWRLKFSSVRSFSTTVVLGLLNPSWLVHGSTQGAPMVLVFLSASNTSEEAVHLGRYTVTPSLYAIYEFHHVISGFLLVSEALSLSSFIIIHCHHQ